MENTQPTNQEIAAYLKTVQAIGLAIRESGPLGIASGMLYAAVMGVMGLQTYESIIGKFTAASLVRKSPGGLLQWIGPRD